MVTLYVTSNLVSTYFFPKAAGPPSIMCLSKSADVIYGRLVPQYTLLTFVPMNLLEQFRRVANSYFLLTFLLTLALPDSPVSPMSWVWSLLSVVLVTMCKQGYEDLLRHKSDRSC